MKTALITGISGQDGSYLAELLISFGYNIIGLSRDIEKAKEVFTNNVSKKIEFVQWNYNNELNTLINEKKPDEFYNFAAYSSGQGMYDKPIEIGKLNGLFVTSILEAILKKSPKTKFCQASSSEVFGFVSKSPKSETAERIPRSPYGAAKQYADSMVKIYREHYGLFATSAILFNHESVRRTNRFVTRKVSSTIAKIKSGKVNKLLIGSLDNRRDWGCAKDYVRGMYLMMQKQKPNDYVFSTGITHSVRDLCEIAFSSVGFDYRDFVVEETGFSRPKESIIIFGDSSKAKKELNWEPTTSFKKIIETMVSFDINLEKGLLL
ncbi:MAG: GDP-mannose 4,6-dehydratase [Crocinitomicaceae bacterium]|nr:GDP-mannose 4,6-dehydratase [Crocinitomicaceae bacterium]